MAEAIALTSATKSTVPASVLFGAQQKASTYTEAREKGVEPQLASALGTAAGVTEASLEKLGLDLLFGKFNIGKNSISNFVANSLIKSVTEGIQEGTQELGSNFWAKIGFDKQRSLMAGVADSAFMGGLLGLAGGGSAPHANSQNQIQVKGEDLRIPVKDARTLAKSIADKFMKDYGEIKSGDQNIVENTLGKLKYQKEEQAIPAVALESAPYKQAPIPQPIQTMQEDQLAKTARVGEIKEVAGLPEVVRKPYEDKLAKKEVAKPKTAEEYIAEKGVKFRVEAEKIAPYYEKSGRNLIEIENADLTLPELRRKLEIAKEGKETDLIPIIKKDIQAQEVKPKVSKEKFRLKDDLQKRGITISNEQEENIIKLNQKVFGDQSVVITAQILTNKQALGKYERGIIEILVGQADPTDTFYHEAVHKYLDVFTDRADHIAILQEGQKKYGIEDFAEIEERVAEDFIKFAKDSSTITGRLKTLFEKLLSNIKAFVGNKSAIETMYKEILAGKARQKIEEGGPAVAKKRNIALDKALSKHGHTEKIIESLKRQGVTDEQIKNIVLENGVKLIDTVKVKRETNGVLSAVITKDTIADIKNNFTHKNLDGRCVKKHSVKEYAKAPFKLAKGLYELPQVYFLRSGIGKYFYDPIRKGERGAQNMKTNMYRRFEDAGLLKRGGWFTPDRFKIKKEEAENIARYYLGRQHKVEAVQLLSMNEKERKFIKIFDSIIKDTENSFYRVARLNGKDPGKVENYAPIMTRDDLELIGEVGDMGFIQRKHPAFFSLKERAKYVPLNLYEMDYRKVATRWINGMADFIKLGEVAPQVKYLANSDEFTDIVGSEFAVKTNDWITKLFTPQTHSEAERKVISGVRFLRHASSIASLGLNYSSVIKQILTQVPLTIIEKAPPKLRSRFARDFGIEVKDLPSIRERQGDIAIADMQGRIDKVFVGPLGRFDRTNAQLSLNALLDKEYKKWLKESNNKEVSPEVMDFILKEAQDRLDMWYGGMTKGQIPTAFRSEVGKMINMFIGPLTSQLRSEERRVG